MSPDSSRPKFQALRRTPPTGYLANPDFADTFSQERCAARGAEFLPRLNLLQAKVLPQSIRRSWIEFVVAPKLWQSCALAIAAATTAFAMQEFFARVAYYSDGSAIWWPINGIALGVLLMARRRHWPWILAGFGVSIGVSESKEPLHTYLSASLCNVLQVWLPALALPRFRTVDKWLSQPNLALRFTFWAVFVASVVSALLGSLYSHGRPGDRYWLIVLRWAAGDALGCALATPLLLSLVSRDTLLLLRPPALAKTAGLIALMTAASWALFHQSTLPIAFALYPLILLVGTQLGLSGAVIAINILALIAAAATLRGAGPFGAQAPGQEAMHVLVMQFYLILSISMALPVSVARVRRLTTDARLKRAAQEMERLAEVDGLTGVANRRRFDKIFDAEWRRATRQHTHLALLMIDADRFKAFNDNYGHLAGDACLRTIAKAISGVPGRPGDLVARYGGEEFAVLLPGSDAVGAERVAERVRRAVYDLDLEHRFHEAQRVTVSIGLASIAPAEQVDQLALIAIADKALYAAKHNGRNQVRVGQALDLVALSV